jgi:restriction endonuclease S subunit
MANAIRDLEKELGFDKLIFEKPKSYSSKFSEVVTHLRSDADFFQMKFRQLEKHIGTIETRTLSSLCTFLKGIEVGSRAYTKTGKLFVRVSNFNSKGLNLTNADKYISEDLYKRLTIFKPMKGDILLTKDGTIGMCYVMTEDIDGIISSGIFKMQLKDKSIPKEYLALAINSKFCQMQAERDCSGALILHWKPSDVKKLRIPILKKEKMKEFSETMIKAKHAKANSIKYLNEAKRIIEELIER